jgi:hypothetical protein
MRLIPWPGRVPPSLACIALAVVLAAAAGWCAVHVSRVYYGLGPYHDDSASYRCTAVATYALYANGGRLAALGPALRQKDGLDVTLRVLLAPSALLPFYGHLAVLLPFLTLFLFLALRLVRERTGSLALGLAAVAFVFALPCVYHPLRGIADYWKDNLATWLLAGAALSWFLSEQLRRRRWSLLCGVLLGLLGMQRTALAVYGALLFAPLLAWGAVVRLRRDGWRTALLDVAAAALPPAAAAGLVAVLQWDCLYRYYLVSCYNFGDRWAIVGYLWGCAGRGGLWTWLALGGAYGLCLLRPALWKQHAPEALAGLWLAAGLPLAIVLTRAHYPAFLAVWQPLLIAVLAALLPRALAPVPRRLFAGTLLAAALACAGWQYAHWSDHAQTLGRALAPVRRSYDRVADALLAQPAPRHYGLFFSECASPFWCQVYFDRHVPFEPQTFYMAVHDSYFRGTYPGRGAPEVAAALVAQMEAYPDALAVAYCEPTDLSRLTAHLEYRDPMDLSVAVFAALDEHLQHSPHWQVVERLALDSFRPVYVFRYSPRPLTAEEKWGAVLPDASPPGTPTGSTP